jgi:predicted acyltransferase
MNSSAQRVETVEQVAESSPPKRVRIAGIDVFRGLVMFLMLFQIVELPELAEKVQKSGTSRPGFWKSVAFHTEHVDWEGGSLHDMIQPGFSFLVGAALAFSMLKRRAQGQTFGRMLLHVVIRSFILVGLGILLRNLKAVWNPSTFIFRFDDTLCQIGLGYTFLFLIACLPKFWHYAAFVGILVAWWVVFAAYPAPPADFDYSAIGVPADWPHHKTGIASHWNKNSNVAAAFDRWFLNMFPREKPFKAHDGGYATLNFVPTLATMLLGLIAGAWLRDETNASMRLVKLVAAMLVCFGAAMMIDYAGLCPIVKRIWTPTWTLWSGGWCLALLTVFHLLCDVVGLKGWALPLIVIGANSIAAYVMSYALMPALRKWMHISVGKIWNEPALYAPHITGLVVFAVVWLILLALYRWKIFLKI